MTRDRRRQRIGLLAAAALLVAGLMPVTAQTGSLDELRAAMAAGRYDDARELLSFLAADDPGASELQVWGQRLSTAPERALELALGQAADPERSYVERVQAALDGAAIALARRDPMMAWTLLGPLVEMAPRSEPGELFLLAGRVRYLVGDQQRAREMLATVRPRDPHFVAARELLGRIGLESGDNELALSYFESAVKHATEDGQADLLAGRWHALQLLGRDVEAREAASELQDRFPTSLSAMEVREAMRREVEELAALADTLDASAPSTLDQTEPDGYSVQLAAFRDRGLALQFVQRWQVEISDLRIARHADDLGQPLYRVQTGLFTSRNQAETEVSRLARQHGLDGFVAGSDE